MSPCRSRLLFTTVKPAPAGQGSVTSAASVLFAWDLAGIPKIGEIMAAMERLRVTLSGFPGGPGVCTFYAISGAAAQGALVTMWTDYALSMPTGISISVAGSGDVIDDVTGNLTGAWTSAVPVVLGGSSSSAYAAGVGFQIVWETATILDNHRIAGATFVVPISGGAFQTNGSLVDSLRAAWEVKAQDAVAATSGNLLCWHRPRKAKAADGSRPAVTARNGAQAEITGAHIVDRVAMLRSRRD